MPPLINMRVAEQQQKNLKPNDLEPVALRNNCDSSDDAIVKQKIEGLMYMWKLPTDANLQRKSVWTRE